MKTDTDQVSATTLNISGMTCAACAARITKRLNQLEGVDASVNYATEQATAVMSSGITVDILITTIKSLGYTATPVDDRGSTSAVHTPDEAENTGIRHLRDRLIGTTVLAVPVLALSMIKPLQFQYWQWLTFALAWPVVLWGAWPFHRAAWTNLRHGAATMDTLISLGTLTALGWSIYALFRGGAGIPGMKMGFSLTIKRTGQDEIYLEVASAVTMFILAGRYFEANAKRRSGAALRALLDLGAKDVAVLRDGSEVRIAIDDLQVGELFVVRPGEKVATDGIVDDGCSAIDASLLTGEPVPVEVVPGASVTGATINTSGRLVVRATRIGADTALAQIAKLVTDAQNGKATVQRLADRVAGVFVPVVIAIAVGTFGFWFGSGFPADVAFTAAVAVLIIACPCALGLATPTALLVGTGRGAQLGILIKGPQVLESTRRIDTIVLDKTGTVTTGRMQLVEIITVDGLHHDEVLRIVGALEEASEHPIAKAIARAATDRVGSLPPVDRFSNAAGLGVRGIVDGHDVSAGQQHFVEELALLPHDLAQAKATAEGAGHTAILAAWDGLVRAVLVVADTVKPSSAAAVRALRDLGLEPVLLTGDNERAARHVADQVGIATVFANVLPSDKVEVVQRLQRQGKVVAMVGDGVNDAAALAQSDLGIAMGTGTDVAIEASDLTIISGDLLGAVDAVRLARRTLRTIKTNLFWAFAYNVAAIPLAACGVLNPLIAGGTMGLSSIFVVSNSLRLRSFSTGRAATANDAST